MKFAPVAALAAAALPFAADTSEAARVTGGETTIEALVSLEELGLGGFPRGKAEGTRTEDNNILLTLPITGGEETDGEFVLEHATSALSLFPLSEGPGANETAGGFVVDTAAATVFGSVQGSDPVPLFDIGEPVEAGLGLSMTDDFRARVANQFSLDGGMLEGTIAAATIDPEVGAPAPIPVPAALPLMGGGLALMGWIGTRRKRT